MISFEVNNGLLTGLLALLVKNSNLCASSFENVVYNPVITSCFQLHLPRIFFAI